MTHAAFVRTIATAVLCATLGSAAFAGQAPSAARSAPTDDPVCTRLHCPADSATDTKTSPPPLMPSVSKHLPDGQPMLVAPRGCGTSCTSPMASERLQNGEPILVAPTCGTHCISPIPTASRRLQEGESILVAPSCTNGCSIRGTHRAA